MRILVILVTRLQMKKGMVFFGGLYLLCTKATATLALLCSSREILSTPLLDQDVAPALVEHFFDAIGHIDDLESRDDLVVFLDVAVVELIEPEAVGLSAVLIQAGDFGLVLDCAFAAERSQRRNVRVHGGENRASVLSFAANIPRAVVPIHAQSIDRHRRIVLFVHEFHHSPQIVGLARRFAYQVYVV